MTLRLPTRVLPRRPTFSLLFFSEVNQVSKKARALRVKTNKTYIETEQPDKVPKSPLSRIPIPCQPIPRLRTWAGGGVALARRDAALYAPVDCQGKFGFYC